MNVICPAPFCKSRVKPFRDQRALTCHLARSTLCTAWIAKNTLQVSIDTLPVVSSHEPAEQEFTIGSDVVMNSLPESHEASSYSTVNAIPHPVPLTNTATHYFVRPFHAGGRTFGTGETPYQMAQRLEADEDNITYPFAGVEEWGLAFWLEKAGLSQNKIDAFLRLDWVCTK